MKKTLDYVKKNKLLAGAVFFSALWCIVLSAYITVTFENPIDYKANLMNTADYPWMSLDAGAQVIMGDYFVDFIWGGENNVRIQLFDNPLNSPPSDAFGGHEQIPSGSRRMQFGFVLHAPIDLNLWLFMLQFDENGRIYEADKVEQVQTAIQYHAGFGAAATNFRRTYSFVTPVHPEAETFRVMIQARPTDELANSSLRLSHMHMNFR